MIKNNNWNGEDRIYIGSVDHAEKIYFSAPSWDCDWYWGFGYLGNKYCHYHLDGLNKDKNLFDAIKEHFTGGLCKALQNDDNLWKFCELVKTAYTLKETAEVLGRGGSHYTNNPCSELIKNTEEVERINNKVLPAIFGEIYNIIK